MRRTAEKAMLLLAVAAGLLTVPTAQAQNPAPEQVVRTLQERPDLAQEVRQRIAASGLTADQIRQRLVAAGYPADLLDPYLPSAAAAAAPAAADARLGSALRALGMEGELEASQLAAGAAVANVAAPQPSLGQVPDEDIFGLDLFRRPSSQFQPSLAGPVDSGYRLGPGDVLALVITGEIELSHSLEVTREGFIVIPQVGQVYVNGLTMESLESLLHTRLGAVYSGIRRGPGASTRFQVSVARLRTNQVFVVGDVVRPGAYLISGAGTALTALYAAGGPTANGSLRRILVRRAGRVVDSLDLYDYLLRGDSRHDVRLEQGDLVFVPVRGTHVQIRGEIIRAKTYELLVTETLRDLVSAAGGFRAAAQQRVQIDRVLPPSDRQPGGRDRVILDLGTDQFADGQVPPLRLQADDRVTVFSVANRRRTYVTVAGNVWTGGVVGYTPDMRLSEALRQAGGVKPDAFLGSVLVSRLNPDSTRSQLRTALRDSAGTPVTDLVLREDDAITVFSRTEFRPSRYVVVTGAVRAPGRIPYREGLTLRDALLLAGGVTEAASLREAELARLPEDRSGGVLAVTTRVPLDSTYLVDRDAAGRYLGPPGESAARSGTAEVPLHPYDNVLIFRQPDWELQRTVTVTGQVRYPGTYSLLRRDERLADLVGRAGGLTRDAYPAGIRFFRPSDAPAGARYRLGVDLPVALREAGHRDNLILVAGDSIDIPEYSPVVRVVGAVNAPTGVAWVPGRDLDYYVGAAGGFSKVADKGRAYVEQPSGNLQSVKRRFLLADSKPKPNPGSVVFVPERDLTDKKDWPGIVGSVASILAGTLTLIVVLTR